MMLLLLILCANYLQVYGAYFSMSDITLNIPGDRSKYPPGNHALATLYALPSKSNRKQVHFRYSLGNNRQKYLQMFHSTGDIMFSKNFFGDSDRDLMNISVTAYVEDSSGEKDNTTFQVNISPPEILDCDLIVPDLCYWQSVTYRISENRNGGNTVGTLSSPYLLDMCTGFKLNYTIIKGGNRFELVPPTGLNKSWSLRTQKRLDRDVQRSVETFSAKSRQSGEFIRLYVKCTVEDPQRTTREVFRNVTVQVLDENDNPPLPQDKGDIDIELHSDYVMKGQSVELRHKGSDKKLIFIDRDSKAVNDHRISLLNDSLNLLNLSCDSIEDDRKGEAQTVTHCKLIFTRSMQIPSLPYTVILQINDTTLLPGSTESSIRIPVILRAGNLTDHPHPMGLTSPPTEFRKPLVLYPHREVTIFRSAGPLARITQPKPDTPPEIGKFVLLNETGHNGAFAITATEGIIYVHDLKLLRKSSTNTRLNVQWEKEGRYDVDELVVSVIEEPSPTCTSMGTSAKEWRHCADFAGPEDCLAACAVATGGSASVEKRKEGGPKRCMWRGDRNPGRSFTTIYSTCTPDFNTCPDGICDSLERLYFRICPQDCSERINVPALKNRKTGRGIAVAGGVCTCDNTDNCICGRKVKINKSNKTEDSKISLSNETVPSNFTILATHATSPNLSRHTGPKIASCGKSCLLGILAGGLFLLGAIVTIVLCWRFDRVHKVRGKFSDESNDLSAPLSDYVDRGVMPENTITLSFDMTTSLTQQNNKMAPDPKWEFPRSQLIIEQTLGEGEFGRVLRARAKDINGQTGYTIVAVKTLKEDAREAELADLLSEYQLLKEVSHPNVIRLLGASTQPGGPVYLIIEFAQYGSLRSYLRRSRHLKSESQLPFSGRLEESSGRENYDEPKHCKVTATDILSFAWQISNGMSYLSDVKLVHRDLAARNVLLSAEKICKISDFGLTRDIYEDDAYFKRSKGRVPVKWMAPESLSDHIYTSKSDVWSFGILIWELVTLGATPYPGIQVQNLFHLLKSGYRMERPENCSPALYKVMKSCWHIDPEERPTFQELTVKWENMLSDQVEYLDLTPNAIHNRSYFCSLEDQEDENENEIKNNELNQVSLEENLECNQENPKCGDSKKLLDESKINNMNQLSQVSETAQGYETPIKSAAVPQRAATPTNENPQYYTNMDAKNSK